jgi:hypothetical protein
LGNDQQPAIFNLIRNIKRLDLFIPVDGSVYFFAITNTLTAFSGSWTGDDKSVPCAK